MMKIIVFLTFLQEKLLNIYFICRFSIFYVVVNSIFLDFGLPIRHNQQFEDVTLGSGKL